MVELWISISTLIFSLILTAIFITNTVYYNRLRNTTISNPPISPTAANNMFIINLMLTIISIIVLLWSIYQVFFSQYRSKIKEVLSSKESIPSVIKSRRA